MHLILGISIFLCCINIFFAIFLTTLLLALSRKFPNPTASHLPTLLAKAALIPVQIQVSQLFLQVRCTRVRNSRYYEISCQRWTDPLAIMVPLYLGPRSPNGIISIFSCDASWIKYNYRKTTTVKRNLINLFFLIPVLLCAAGPRPKLVYRT